MMLATWVSTVRSVSGDAFRNMSGPMSWLVSIGLGLLGALVGWRSGKSPG
jgi:hypothetical protein